ncbi:muscleblind-like protein 1 isoform X16 [Ascaphus truei]|uniref:muscleblind-like protein 1 isoform X16 n=1 Tax=Ascaphus truei TaxID=8439 RepID=UPI003F5A3DC4
MAVSVGPIRDTKWLTLEVCREFQRGTCSRPDTECKFAHPSKSCQVENGRVIACFDSLKNEGKRRRRKKTEVINESIYSTTFSLPLITAGRCSRENCKYLHPPPHLKTQLEINGRNNLIQQKNMAMLAQQMQLANAMMPGTQLQHMPMFSVAPSLATNASAAFNPYMGPVSPGMVQAEIMPTAQMLVAGNHGVAAAQKLMRTDRLEASYNQAMRASPRCPTNDLNPEVEGAPSLWVRGSSVSMPAQSWASPEQRLPVVPNYVWWFYDADSCPMGTELRPANSFHLGPQAGLDPRSQKRKGFPQSILPPLPKRPALEKTNGATAMFNTGFFQYQQALANMQLQQQAAFFPPGSILCMTPAASVVPMLHGASPAAVSAAATSASSVPFAAAAAANQIPIMSAEHLSSHKYVTQM